MANRDQNTGDMKQKRATYLTCSGFFAAGLFHPSRLVIRSMCTSMPRPRFLEAERRACRVVTHHLDKNGIAIPKGGG